MGKGSCKKTATKEQDSEKTKDYECDKQTRSHSKDHDSKPTFSEPNSANTNKNLIRYAKSILEDPNNRSLTKDHITMEMARSMVNVRTADDVGLGQCIFVNFNNVSSMFPYAVSPDCYCVFCDFFGPLIDSFQGFPREEADFEPKYGDLDRHARMDLNCTNRNRIIYSDIVVRRNIGGVPFTPMIKAAGRKEVTHKLETLFRKIFEKEKEAAQIPSEWVHRFETCKSELNDVGAMKGYPDGRLHLVYETAGDMHQGIVLNFDDHLQIIASCNSGKIGQLYKAMHDVCCNESLDNVDFVVHPNYGYLTLSPAHIGTCMTLRVIARFPFLSLIEDLEMTLLKNHHVQVKFDGKPCTATGLITLSNKLTLNKREEDIFNDVIDAFKVLCQLEEEFEQNSPMAVQDNVMPVESLFRLTNMISLSESKSFTKKYLTASLIGQYEKVMTSFQNGLSNCIRANAYFPESLYPRAADSDCYSKYRQFFTPILYEINKINTALHSVRPCYGSASDSSVFMLYHRDVHSFRVRFSRNFEKYPFPLAMNEVHRAEVERLLLNAFEEFPLEIEGEYCQLSNVRKSMFFGEMLNFNMLPILTKVDVSAGFYRDWPNQRGIFFIKTDHRFPEVLSFIFVNVTEHVKVVCLDKSGKNFPFCYDRAVKIMQFLDLRFDKMFSRKLGYGYLTSFPQSVGCGLRISAMVYLNNLGEKREVFERVCKASQLQYRGSRGAGTPAIGNVFDVSLKANMNVTEKWILITFCQRLKDLLLVEGAYDPRIPKPTNDVFIHESLSDIEGSAFFKRSKSFSSESDTLDSNAGAGVSGKENLGGMVVEDLEK